jgi:cell division protein FtsL
MTTQTAPVRSIATAPSHPAVARQHAARRRRPWLWFTAVVLLAFFGLIASRISLDQSAFTVDRLEDEIAAEQAVNMELQLRIAELRDPDRIASRASAMGMVYPDRQMPLEVEPGPSGPGTSVDRWAELQAVLGSGP